MGRREKTFLYKYENTRNNKSSHSGDEVASISLRKAKQVESFKKCMRKRAKKKGIILPEEENEEK